MPTLKEIYDPRHSRELIKTIDKKFYGNFAISEADEYTDPELERAQSKGVELIEKIVKTNDRAYVSTRGSFLKSNRSSFREIIDNEPTKAPGTPLPYDIKKCYKKKEEPTTPDPNAPITETPDPNAPATQTPEPAQPVAEVPPNERDPTEQRSKKGDYPTIFDVPSKWGLRRKLERDGYALVWKFDKPNKEHVDFLKYQLSETFYNPLFQVYLFDTSTSNQLKALNLLKYDNYYSYYYNSDLILKYLTLKFHDNNPYITYTCIDFMDHFFSILQSNFAYKIDPNYEAEFFLPHFVFKLGDPRFLVRKGFRHLVKKLLEITDFILVFNALIRGLKEDRSDESKIECLEEIGYLIDRFGLKQFNPVSYREITKLIGHSNERVSIAALNTLTFSYFKYKDLAMTFIGKLDEDDEQALDQHICLYEQSKIFPIMSSIFLVDSITIIDAIRTIVNSLNTDLQQENENQQKKINDIAVILADILDNHKDFSIASLIEIEVCLESNGKRRALLPYLDRLILVCSFRLTLAIDEHFKNNGKKDDLLIELISVIIKVLNGVFGTGFSRPALTESVKYCLFVVLKTLNDDKFDLVEIKTDLDLLLNLILKDSFQTSCFCALIRILTESVKESYENKAKICEAVVSHIWDKLKNIDDPLYEDNKLNFKYISHHEVLYELHLFFEACPVKTWDESKENDLAIRTINTVLYHIVNGRYATVLSDLTDVAIHHDAEIRDFIMSIMDWIDNNQRAGGTLED